MPKKKPQSRAPIPIPPGIIAPLGVKAICFAGEDPAREVRTSLGEVFRKTEPCIYIHPRNKKNTLPTIDETMRDVYRALLDPSTGQIVLGISTIGDYQPGPRHPNPKVVWGRGNDLGSLYTLTAEDLEQRLGHNEVTVGKVRPRDGPVVSTHQFDKKMLLKPGDQAVCVNHSGDYHFDYQLVFGLNNHLYRVKGMEFSAYALSDPKPVKLMPVIIHFGNLP